MTRHLSVDECAAAVDGSLDLSRGAHLDACEHCQREVESFKAVVAAIAAADVPEPSPLFWDHFSARVRAATVAAPVSDARGWTTGWRWWSALAASACILALAFVWERSSWRVVDPSGIGRPAAIADAGPSEADADHWESVMALATDWSSDDLLDLTGEADVSLLIDDLTPAERVEFVRLLRQEMGVAQ